MGGRLASWSCASLLMALLAAAPAFSQVVNPSFEMGVTGWTQYGGGDFVPPANPFGMTSADGDGAFWHAVRSFSSNGDIDGLYQTVTTTPGVDYTLTVAGQAHNFDSFAYIDGSASTFPNDTDVRVGVDLTGRTNHTARTVTYTPAVNTGAQWEDLQLEFTATGTDTTIFLDSRQQFAFAGNWTGFDDVRLFAQVPEPASIAIWSLAGLFAGLFFWPRRRK